MTITRVNTSGAAAVASGALSVPWQAQTAGNTQVLHVLAFGSQIFPTTISGWTKEPGEGSGAGYSSASYSKPATGSETGSQAVLTATVPCIAWIDQYNSSLGAGVIVVNAVTFGVDSDDAATGIICTGSSVTTITGDMIATATVWASSSPSFPTVPAGAANRAITQTGATLAATVQRASASWQTNHRYNISDGVVTTGGTGAPKYVSNTTTANLRGLTTFVVLSEQTGTSVTIAVPTLGLTILPVAPQLLQTSTESGPTPSIPITVIAPNVSAAVNIEPPTASVAITPIAPAVDAFFTATISPDPVSIHISTPTPVINQGAGVAAPTTDIPITHVAPELTTQAVLDPSSVPVPITPVAPVISTGVVIQPPPASINTTLLPPLVYSGTLEKVDVALTVGPTRTRDLAIVEPSRVGSVSASEGRQSWTVKEARTSWTVNPSRKER